MFKTPEIHSQAGEEGNSKEPNAAQNSTLGFFPVEETHETDVEGLMDELRQWRAMTACREKVIASQEQKIKELEKQIKDIAAVVAQQKFCLAEQQSCLTQMQEERKLQEQTVQKWKETMLAEPGTARHYKTLYDETKPYVRQMAELVHDQGKAMEKHLDREREFWRAHAEYFRLLLV